MAPHTQADLDALTAAEVAELTDGDLAAAFARLVAGVDVGFRAFGSWVTDGKFDRTSEDYGFTPNTIAEIEKLGWGWNIGNIEVRGAHRATINCYVKGSFVWNTYVRDAETPARALLTAAVLAAIAERDD